MAWAINKTLDVCKGAITPGSEYAETYLEAVWNAAKRASQGIKSDAAARGKGLHKAVERSLAGDSSKSPDAESYQGDFSPQPLIDWILGLQVTVREVERRVYSRRHRFSGTFDCLASLEDGTLVLLDWKTSKSIYPEFLLQTAAYVLAYEEEFPDKKIAGRYLVRIAEDGSVEPHYFPRSTLRKDFAAFLGAKTLFDRVQVLEKEGRKAKKLL